MIENKNRYYKHSRISEAKFRQILRCFSMDLTATDTAGLTGISVRSINSIYLKIRARIISSNDKPALAANTSSAVTSATTPATRTHNDHNLTQTDKTLNDYIAFGIVHRGEHIYTELAPNTTRQILLDSSRHGPKQEDLVSSEGWNDYDGLVDVNQTRLYRINKDRKASEDIGQIMNHIDSFWDFAKRRLAQFNGIHKHTFILHLKETEYRFNYRRDNLYSTLLKMLRSNPL